MDKTPETAWSVWRLFAIVVPAAAPQLPVPDVLADPDEEIDPDPEAEDPVAWLPPRFDDRT